MHYFFCFYIYSYQCVFLLGKTKVINDKLNYIINFRCSINFNHYCYFEVFFKKIILFACFCVFTKNKNNYIFSDYKRNFNRFV